jgi:hypothetical protein
MHPVISRFLNLTSAVETLEKSTQALNLDPVEQAFVRQASAHPAIREALLAAKGKKQPGRSVQESLIFLSTFAAMSCLREDEAFAPKLASVTNAFLKEGATEEQASQFIVEAILEEAFAYAEDPTVFDRDFFAETLGTLERLATVGPEAVDDWLEDFARAGEAAHRPLRLSVAESLLNTAWSEGPAAITPEHLDDALELLEEGIAETERTSALETLSAFLAFLGDRNVLGPLRKARLSSLIANAIQAGPDVGDDDSEDDDDDSNDDEI